MGFLNLPFILRLQVILFVFPVYWLTACLQDQVEPNRPVDIDSTTHQEPALSHTLTQIRVPIGATLYDTLFIRNGNDSEWQFYLVDGSSGVRIQGNVLSYTATDTLTTMKQVSVAAKHRDGKILTASWPFQTLGINHYPVILRRSQANWIAVGEVWRETLTVYDVDGDSLSFTHNLPEGAEFKDSIFTWTPRPNQVGNVTSSIQVNDGLGGSASVGISILVFASDPNRLAARLEVGRTWWIEAEHVGFNYPIRGQYDSVLLRRRIEIRYHNPETDSFVYALFDTLTGTRNETSEIEIGARRANHFGFSRGNHAFRDLVPFEWPQPPELVMDTVFEFGATELPGKYFIHPNTCLTGAGNKHGCGGSTSTWVPGWGKVAETKTYRAEIVNESLRYRFQVWATNPN